MLSKKQLLCAFYVYSFLSKIGFFPFVFERKTGQIWREKSKFRWRWWWFLLSLVACRAILGTLRIIVASAGSAKTPIEEIPMLLNQLLYWLPLYCFPVVLVKYMDVTIGIFNSLLQKPCRRTTWRSMTIQELAVIAILPPNIFVIPLLYAAILIMKPMAMSNFFSALTPSLQTTPVLVAIALTEAFIATYIWASFVFFAHTLLLLFQKCIEETRHTLNKVGNKGLRNTFDMKTALRGMRSLQMLILVYNGGYRHVHFVVKFVSLFYFICGSAFGIIIINSSPIISAMYLFFGGEIAIMYCILFHKAFAIPMLTKKVKNKLAYAVKASTDSDSRPYLGAWVKSIPTIGIQVGNFHLFERMSTPNFLAFGIKNIIRIVIAYRSK